MFSLFFAFLLKCIYLINNILTKVHLMKDDLKQYTTNVMDPKKPLLMNKDASLNVGSKKSKYSSVEESFEDLSDAIQQNGEAVPEKKAAASTEVKKVIKNGIPSKDDERKPADEITQDDPHWEGEQKQDEDAESFRMAVITPGKPEPSITPDATPECHTKCADITGPSMNFYYKECSKVRKTGGESCGCGKVIREHSRFISEEVEDGSWNSTHHTKKVQSYPRKILFNLNETTGDQAKAAWYLRLSDDTRDIDVQDYHASHWPGTSCAEIVICFLGGCGPRLIKKKIEDALTDGLTQLLNSLNCLLLTRASNVGVSKLVGTICNKESQKWKRGYVSRCVGIMPWGCVANRELLQCNKSDNVIHYHVDEQKEDEYGLDPNHHDFLLIDDGSTHKYGAEIPFRSSLQQSWFTDSISNVNVLVGGGRSSLVAIHTSLFPQNDEPMPVPAVIVKNSGELADVFADVLGHVDPDTRASCASIMNSLEKHLNLDDAATNEAIDLIYECVNKRRDQLFVYDVDKDEKEGQLPLNHVILEAALQGSKDLSVPNRVQLAMELKDIDKVREILKDGKNGWKEVYTVMHDSLNHCNLNRVKELIEVHHFDVEGYVKIWLYALYKVHKEDKDAKTVYDKIDLTRLFAKKGVTKEITVKRIQHECLDVNEILQRLSIENTADTHLFDNRLVPNPEVINPTQALLINRIIMNQQCTARLFWYFDKYNGLSNALLAYTLLNGVRQMKIHRNMREELDESMGYYQERIVGLLDVYYKTDQKMAMKALTRKVPLWRCQTLVDVAGDIGLKAFIEQPACQLVLSKARKGQDTDTIADLEKLKKKRDAACFFPKMFYYIWYMLATSIGVPHVKKWIHMTIYLLSLAMFSYYVMVKTSAAHVPIKWIIFAIVSSMTLDEARQINDIGRNFCLNLKLWASSAWNILDFFSIIVYYFGFMLSFLDDYLSKIVFAVFLFIWWIKFTQFLRTSALLGLYVVMILQMVTYMKTFLVVLLIAVVGYGVFMTALLFPDSPPSWNVLFHVIFRPYLLMFGEMGLEQYELNNSTTIFGTEKVQTESEILVVLGMSAFLLFANVLLLNLLIAAFSNIYEDVQARSTQIWRYEQYLILKEFQNKPILPMPFSVFENIYILLKCRNYCKFCSCGGRNEQTGDCDCSIQETEKDFLESREIADFERYCMMKLYPQFPEEEVP